jgi:aryl-alcohol dehydrogenase-like predicted oxidoreductase
MRIPLAIGTAQFGSSYGIANTQGRVDRGEIARILTRAWDAGVDTLDTAAAYGVAESALGDVGVSHWKVVSKIGPVPAESRDAHSWVLAAIDACLDRLRLDRLDAMLLHQPDELLSPNGGAIYSALGRAKTEGRIGRIGVSIYEPEQLDVLTREFHFDLVQAPFNAFDRRMQSSGWMMRLGRRGIGLHVRSVFLQGLLLMDDDRRPSSFDPWTTLWQAWRKWLRHERVTALEAATRFVLAWPDIERAVVGVDSEGQLAEILAAMQKGPLDLPTSLQCDDPGLINPSRWTLA